MKTKGHVTALWHSGRKDNGELFPQLIRKRIPFDFFSLVSRHPVALVDMIW